MPPAPPSVPPSPTTPPNPEGYLKLSDTDIERIKEIDPEITDALVRIITSPYDTFSTVKRDKEGKIISFIICTPEIDGIVYIKYFFNIVNARRNLRGLVSKIKRFSNVRSLSLQESDLRHMAIDIRKANRFLVLNGFESNLDKYTEANMYTLPSAYSLDVVRYDGDRMSREYRSWIKYMIQNHNAAEVWTILHQRDRYHVEDLMLVFYKNNKKQKDKKDIQIYRLYGAIHTILKEVKRLARLANSNDIKIYGEDGKKKDLLTKCNSIEELFELARNIDKENDRKRRAHDYADAVAGVAADCALSIVEDESGAADMDQEGRRKKEEKQMMDLHRIIAGKLEEKMLVANAKNYNTVIRQALAEMGINANAVANNLYMSGDRRFDDASLYAITYREPITKLIDLPTLPYTLYTLNTKEEMKKESDMLGHCVGDSDFYIDKVRSREILVISLRQRGSRAELHSDRRKYYLGPDLDPSEIVEVPKFTIEYDLRTHAIRQWRGGGDRPVNSLPDNKELVLDTLAAFATLGASDPKYIVECVSEDFEYDIYYDKIANEYRINDAESASVKTGALNPIDLVDLSRKLQEQKRVTNLRRPLQDPNIIVLKGMLALDNSYTQEEIERLCKVRGLILDMTNLPTNMKRQIKSVEGNLSDSYFNGGDWSKADDGVMYPELAKVSGDLIINRERYVNFKNLEYVGGDLVTDWVMDTDGIGNIKYIGGDARLSSVATVVEGDTFFKNCKIKGNIYMSDLESLGETGFLESFKGTFYYNRLHEYSVQELRAKFPNVEFTWLRRT